MFKSLSQILEECDLKKKKGAPLFQTAAKLAITLLHIFQKGFCQAYTSLRKSQAFMHAKEVNGEQMCSTPVMKLQQLSFVSIQ